MSAIAYNLKKYLKFVTKNAKIGAQGIRVLLGILKDVIRPQIRPLQHL